MDVIRAYMSLAYWRHGFSFTKAASALLSAFGALWLIIEIASFFSERARSEFQPLWYWFLIIGILAALWINKPLHAVSCKLRGRDISLTVCVGDLFKAEGALVIGTNSTFDTDVASGLIDKKSVQGQFTEKFYDSISHLDSDLADCLKSLDPEVVEGKIGKVGRYPLGTVAKIAPKGRTAYFLAIASLNPAGVAVGSFEELKIALPSLWEYVGSSGTFEPIAMPVLGTGFSRIPETREEIIREIIKSFIAACADRRFTEALTIVIPARDVYRNDVNLSDLGKYMKHVCTYTEYGSNLRPGRGQAIV